MIVPPQPLYFAPWRADAVVIRLDIDLYTRCGERPYNRTLVNKGIAIGLLEPAQAALPDTGATLRSETVRGLDPRARRLRLESGDTHAYDALLSATGSRARTLDEEVIGRDQAVSAGRLTTLHSAADAVRVRDLLATTKPARVLILGGGLVASETASLLTDAGHELPSSPAPRFQERTPSAHTSPAGYETCTAPSTPPIWNGP